MMKIRPYLLVSISYISLCSLAQADISAVENEFIFTHTSNTHLASQPQLLSSSNLPQTQSEHRDLSAPISLPQAERIKRRPFASVCFITDTSDCSGNQYSGENTLDGGSSGGDDNGDDWEINNQERCNKEGYTQTSCNSVEEPAHFCPYDNTYFEKCVCKAGLVMIILILKNAFVKQDWLSVKAQISVWVKAAAENIKAAAIMLAQADTRSKIQLARKHHQPRRLAAMLAIKF